LVSRGWGTAHVVVEVVVLLLSLPNEVV